jgi:hypothetical protein
MRAHTYIIMTVAVAVLLAARCIAQASVEPARKVIPLTSVAGLTPHNAKVEPATHRELAGVRVTIPDHIQNMSVEERQRLSSQGKAIEQLALIDGLEFGDGAIEAEISGEAQTSVFEGARGFVGIAFRVQKDLRSYDAFYLRPMNGRANDQVRRNHSAQYISHPEWPWFRLRKEFPEKYESYVDLVPGEWTKIRIEVHGDQARLFVHGAAQPTLIVNDLKTGKDTRGGIALWVDIGTVAHFRNLVVTR